MKLNHALYVFSSLMALLLLGCGSKPNHHPKNPNYAIEKPPVKYSPNKKNLSKMVKDLQGSPYVWAEEGPNNFDCSGFTYYLYGSMGIEIPRVARAQAKVGKRVTVKNLQYGDLIFFATSKKNRKKITHVGLYLGDGWFTHASTIKYEVVYSNLFTSSYYKKYLRVCRRYLPEETQSIPSAKPWKKDNTTLIKAPGIQANKAHKAVVIKAPFNQITSRPPSSRHYIQVGSYMGYPKRTIMNAVKRYGFAHTIIRFDKDGNKIAKLLIGPFKNKQEAHKTLPLVKQRIEKSSFIAEIH
ncbi:MAG: NlpC/P60 family protein [Campylobacterota bacterium]|nr:NlpC/P60 family protein [Campylobacterota bacterium]